MGVRAMKTTLTLRYVVMAIVAGVVLAPFLWMVVTSLQTPENLTNFPPELIPKSPRFGNYAEVFRTLSIGTFFFNSVKISVLGTIGEVLAAALGAFAFARMEF